MLSTPLWPLLNLLFALLVAPVPQTDPPLDDGDTVAMLKAGYLFKFASSSDWPSEAKTGSFKIGVYNNQNVFSELAAKYATKPIGNQALEVIRIDQPDQFEYCHVVYAAGANEDALKKITRHTSGKPTLLVGDGKSALQKGATIAFVVVDNSTRYIINPEEAQKRKISLGSTILLWAVSN